MENEMQEGKEIQPDNSISDQQPEQFVEQAESEDTTNYAGFWVRFFASILDSIILGIVVAIILFLGYDMLIGNDPVDFATSVGVFQYDYKKELTNSLLIMLATIVFWIYRGATPGKMMMGMHIVDASTGEAPTNGKLILRYFSYIVSTIPLCLGFIWVGIDKRKQGFHDKIANTVVIMNPPKTDEGEED